MSLFSKTKVVLWPKEESLEIYLDSADNNSFSFETNLWKEQSEENLRNLATFFHQNKISEVNVLLEDTYVVTKTFIYDSIVTKLDPAEVITLAKDSLDFPISPEAVTFDLENDNNRTLVRARIFNQEKFNQLTANLQKLSLKVLDYETVSSSIVKIYTNFDNGQYFFFYPLNQHDYVAILCQNGHVYLTSLIKKTLPELKKLLNYAQAYFGNKDPKQYLPEQNYNEAEICQSFHKTTNIPLPVLAFFVGSQMPTAIIKPSPVIIDSTLSPKPMENPKKNILPIIVVFIVTATLASLIVWFILNRNNKATEINNPGTDNTQVIPTSAPIITEAPTPTAAPVSKTIKIQVLNATDINGQAATIKAELTKLGFTSVATGNSKETATSNSLQIKKTVSSAYFTQNIAEFATVVPTELSATSSYDVIFTIGVDLSTGSAPAATATAAPKASPTISN
ncbi:MAG: LytR C-terminal domain-containing protein [Candidatus Shapirobacteria bacterium]|jgi:hypothetical protein